jgi:hypothetical protein
MNPGISAAGNDHPVSMPVADARYAAGHLVRAQTAADTRMAIDTSPAADARHQPSDGRSLRKQRTVNPLIVPARYNFLYPSSRPALRAAACSGRPRPAQPYGRKALLRVGMRQRF